MSLVTVRFATLKKVLAGTGSTVHNSVAIGAEQGVTCSGGSFTAVNASLHHVRTSACGRNGCAGRRRKTQRQIGYRAVCLGNSATSVAAAPEASDPPPPSPAWTCHQSAKTRARRTYLSPHAVNTPTCPRADERGYPLPDSVRELASLLGSHFLTSRGGSRSACGLRAPVRTAELLSIPVDEES